MTFPPTLSTPPPSPSPSNSFFYTTHFPTPQILLVIFNRPKSLNCMNIAAHWALHELFAWYDAEKSLRCAVVTGMGRAFSAGADLKEWNENNANTTGASDRASKTPPSGFGGLSRRSGKKPVILAVNGLAYGGGCEILINADMVFASQTATLALPEVKRGVTAIAGALPRLIRTVGRPRAMEMALTGRTLSAAEAERWGLVNEVVEAMEEDERAGDVQAVMRRAVVKRAVEVAGNICENSPDAVIVAREGMKMGWEGVGVEEATSRLQETWGRRLNEGENIKEGVRAFVEKRKPRWRDSKL